MGSTRAAIDKVMNSSLEELADAEFVKTQVLRGDETSAWNNAVIEVLQIRRVVEDMKASRASSHAAAKVIRLTLVNAFLTLLIVLVTACGIGWNIFSSVRWGSAINVPAAAERASQLVPGPDG